MEMHIITAIVYYVHSLPMDLDGTLSLCIPVLLMLKVTASLISPEEKKKISSVRFGWIWPESGKD